ncbi:MAG: hypothetical protein P8Y27_18400, partial [Chromatiaceae bacterium]
APPHPGRGGPVRDLREGTLIRSDDRPYQRRPDRASRYIDLDSLTPDRVYSRMTQTLTPRPIAWVLSENADV